MVDVDREPQPLPGLMPTKKQQRLSTAMKRTSEWIFSEEIPSDITVQVGEATFSLHKIPLVSKCGYIRKLVSEAKDADLSLLELPELPGGAEAFELAAKFCYGINFEINTGNVALLRCAAGHLEMTEDYAAGNLVARAEDYLGGAALATLPGAISVLRRAQGLLPASEGVVGRCVDAVACMACSQEAAELLGPAGGEEGLLAAPAGVVEWWAEELTALGVEVFRRVVVAMRARGFREHALGPALMLYAQKSLRGLEMHGKGGRKRMEGKEEHEKRVVLETVVSLLPRGRNAMSVSFLSMLLRAATQLETTVACRLDLERRVASQLGRAVLDDLLIPSSSSFAGDTAFDLDAVQRILVGYLDDGGYHGGDVEQVGALMEGYLAEIASDPNLGVARFAGFAEVIPEQARTTEDGMYRAIDIYLKAHPSLSDAERKKVCGVMDCQKLSREACAHAAQNSRLPVQVVVQVLYYEQHRLRDHHHHHRLDQLPPSPDELSRLRRENEGLKLELVRARAGMDRAPAPARARARAVPPSSPALHRLTPPKKPSIMNTVTQKLGRLNPFLRSDAAKPKSTKPPKNRRYSIS